MRELGEHAVRSLLAEIDDELPYRAAALTTQLVVRESTARPD
jgi:DNA-binding LacI/PurR family transcriptional regulator